MKAESDAEELKTFQREATYVLQSANFPVHKWESDVQRLESEDVPHPNKVVG